MVSAAGNKKLDRDRPLSSALKILIDQARVEPQSQHTLLLYAHRFALQPQSFFDRSDSVSVKNLVQLILQYVQYLPTHLDEFNEYCQRCNWQTVADQSNKIIASFFERSELILLQTGIIGLLDKVYFSHRLIEELHDHMMCNLGTPATSWNMTAANLLVHQWLGNDYAAKLDETVIELAHKLTAHAPVLTDVQTQKNQANAWPCFCAHHGVNLNF